MKNETNNLAIPADAAWRNAGAGLSFCGMASFLVIE
jgi:hypothetical protein